MQCQAVEKLYLHCLPSDPNISKERMNFIFNDVLDHVSKNFVLCSLHFIVDLFRNMAQSNAGFSEIVKVKDDVVLSILDSTAQCE